MIKHGWASKTLLSEVNRHKRYILCDSIYINSLEKAKTETILRVVSVVRAQQWRWEIANGQQWSLGYDGNVLKLDGFNGCTPLQI